MSDKAQLIGLTTPFPDKYVEPAPGGHGNYVGHDIVTQRLLRVVGPFDYHVIQVITSPEGMVEGCLATLTITVDGRQVSVTEVGDCDNAAQKKTQGDRLKNASSDAIKRCAMRLGLGLHVWSDPQYFLHDQLAAKAPEDNHAFDAPGATLYDELDPERPFIPRQNTSLPLDTAPVEGQSHRSSTA